jgi:uncharacterized protein YaiL (DUF2058 family)
MSLRDQMLKAGLISEKEARQAEHRKRVKSKQTHGEEPRREADARRQEVERERERERAAHRQREGERQSEQEKRERGRQAAQKRQAAIEAAYREGLVGNSDGPRRYYYAVQGRIELMMVSDEVGRRLEAGQLAIVQGERLPQRHCLLNAGAAKKLREVAPERILAFHGAKGESCPDDRQEPPSRKDAKV